VAVTRKKSFILRSFCLLVIFVLLSGCSYTWNLKVLTRRQAIEDIDYLVENIENIHYDPFARLDVDDFNAYVQTIKSGFDEKVTRKDLSISIMEMLELLEDEHTNLGSFPDFMKYIRSGGKVLPFNLDYRNGDYFVTNAVDANEPEQLKTDVRLVEIDDKPVDSFVEKYRRFVSAQSDYFKNIIIAARFKMYFWYFEGPRDNFKVKMEDAETGVCTKVVEAFSSRDYKKYDIKKKVKAEDMFTYRFFRDGDVCLFKATSFDSLNEDLTENVSVRKKLIKILDNLVADMNRNNCSILLVDLRDNGGGDKQYGIELLKRTADKPFELPQEHIRNSKAARKNLIINGLEKNRIPAFLNLEKIIDFRLYGMKKKDFDIDGQYWHGRQEVVKPFDDHWDGKIVLLVDGLTCSAAVGLASIVKDNNLGLIAGQETGGRATFYGGMVPLILPNSGLVCNLSNVLNIRPAGFDDGRGVLPDLELDVTLDDEVLIEKIYDYIMMNSQN
jgi:hypothetical protein